MNRPRHCLGRACLLMLIVSLGSVPVVNAAEIKGTVRAVSSGTATVAVEGDSLPAVGDTAEIYFKLAGSDDDISVATARVEKAQGDSVQLKVENATGAVEKGQLARITSPKPQPRSATGAGASSPAPRILVQPSATAAATHSAPLRTAWDFSAGDRQDVESDGTDIVDASRWDLTGGSHMRFLTGGRSWMTARFTWHGAGEKSKLVVRHLSSSPDGKKVGYSPVRITLNGTSLFEGSPQSKGFITQQFELQGGLHDGENVLRWEFLSGATTHYWLKSFAIAPEEK